MGQGGEEDVFTPVRFVQCLCALSHSLFEGLIEFKQLLLRARDAAEPRRRVSG